MAVFDLLGRRVKKLTPAGRSAGKRSFTWDGSDQLGQRVSPGIYFLQMRAAGASATHKIIVLR